MTPLHCALEDDIASLEVVQLLLENAGDVEALDKVRTLSSCATMN
jgi:hypothetical protein